MYPDKNDTENNDTNSGADVYISNPLLDFQLNQTDRFGDLLFLFAMNYSFLALDKADQAYCMKREGELTKEEDSAISYDIASLLAFTNWIYLIAGSLFFDTSSLRLQELKKALPENPSLSDKERITGREMVTMGAVYKMIGYTLAANGFEWIKKSVLDESEPSEDQEDQGHGTGR